MSYAERLAVYEDYKIKCPALRDIFVYGLADVADRLGVPSTELRKELYASGFGSKREGKVLSSGLRAPGRGWFKLGGRWAIFHDELHAQLGTAAS